MMKKLLVVLGILVVILAIGLGVIVYRAKDIAIAYKPTIEEQLTNILGAKVAIQDLSLSIVPKTHLQADGIAIGSGNKESGDLALEKISAQVELLPLLSKKLVLTDLQLVRPSVTIVKTKDGTFVKGLPRNQPKKNVSQPDHSQAPKDETSKEKKEGLKIQVEQISITDGTVAFQDEVRGTNETAKDLNVTSEVIIEGTNIRLPSLKVSAKVLGDTPVSVSGSDIFINQQAGGASFREASVNLPGGTIRAEGNFQGEVSPKGTIKIACPTLDLQTLVKSIMGYYPKLASYRDMPVSVQGLEAEYVLSTTALTIAKGSIRDGEITIPVSGTINTSSMSGHLNATLEKTSLATLLSEAKRVAPATAPYNGSGTVGARLAVDLAGLGSYTVKGPITLDDIKIDLQPGLSIAALNGGMDLGVTPGAQRAENLNVSLQVNGEPLKVQGAISVERNAIQASKLHIDGFDGSMDLPFALSLQGAKSVSAEAHVAKIDLTRLLRATKPDLASKLTGTLTKADSRIRIDRLDAAIQTFSGNGSLALNNGSLKGINLPNVVLSKVDNLPFLQGQLSSRIPPRYAPVFSAPDTPIRELVATYTATQGRVSLSQLSLISDLFTLESSGTITLANGALDLDATMYFTPEFSATLAQDVKELRKVLTADGRLAIPVSLKGVPPALLVVPNTRQLIELAGQKIIKDKAGEVLDKALGKGSPGAEGARKALENLLGF